MDQLNGIKSKSETLELTILDPCDTEVLKITPFTEPSVTFIVGEETPLIYQIEIERNELKCPVELSLQILCNNIE